MCAGTRLGGGDALRELELRWPCHGPDRRDLPLFPDAHGSPLKDHFLAKCLKLVLAYVLGDVACTLYSMHSWRVGLATHLLASGASGPSIQAFCRWLSPESLKIYARLGFDDYAYWMNRILNVSISAVQTTSIPVIDAAQCDLQGWQQSEPATPSKADATFEQRLLRASEAGDSSTRRSTPMRSAEAKAPPPPLSRGDRVSVLWTDMDRWFDGTFQWSFVETGDDGEPQRTSCILYDAVDEWKAHSAYHCLEDEYWQRIG